MHLETGIDYLRYDYRYEYPTDRDALASVLHILCWHKFLN